MKLPAGMEQLSWTLDVVLLRPCMVSRCNCTSIIHLNEFYFYFFKAILFIFILNYFTVVFFIIKLYLHYLTFHHGSS